MNILSWNCIGTSSRGFGSMIGDIRREYCSSSVCLLESHACGKKAIKLTKD